MKPPGSPAARRNWTHRTPAEKQARKQSNAKVSPGHQMCQALILEEELIKTCHGLTFTMYSSFSFNEELKQADF